MKQIANQLDLVILGKSFKENINFLSNSFFKTVGYFYRPSTFSVLLQLKESISENLTKHSIIFFFN